MKSGGIPLFEKILYCILGILVLISFIIPFTSASNFGYDTTTCSAGTSKFYIQNLTANVNDSQFLEGHPASYFYPNSNPAGYITNAGEIDPIFISWLGTFLYNYNQTTPAIVYTNANFYNKSTTNSLLATPNLHTHAWANLTNFPSNCSANQFVRALNSTDLICTTPTITGSETDPRWTANSTLVAYLANQGDWNVNSSDYWDNLNTPDDINSMVNFYNKSDIDGFNSSWSSNYNSTYDATSADVLANRSDWFSKYNSTYDAISADVTANRSAWFSTYNLTYDTWAYNQTTINNGITLDAANITNEHWVNESGDTMTGKLIIKPSIGGALEAKLQGGTDCTATGNMAVCIGSGNAGNTLATSLGLNNNVTGYGSIGLGIWNKVFSDDSILIGDYNELSDSSAWMDIFGSRNYADSASSVIIGRYVNQTNNAGGSMVTVGLGLNGNTFEHNIPDSIKIGLNVDNGLAQDYIFMNGTGMGFGKENPAADYDFNGTVKANAFIGDGSQITNLSGLDNYVLKSGDNMSGDLNINAKLYVNNSVNSTILRMIRPNGMWDLRVSDNSSNDLVFYNVIDSRPSLSILESGKVIIGTVKNPNATLTITSTGDSIPPPLGTNGGRLALLNDNYYGLLAGILGTGDAYLQAQRVDGTPTYYNLKLQPNGGNVTVNGTVQANTLEAKKLDIINYNSSDNYKGINVFLNSTDEWEHAYGVYSNVTALDQDAWVYGLFGSAYGGAPDYRYGVYGLATGSSGTSYGVYGKANGSTNNYGVYSEGDGMTTGVHYFDTNKNSQMYYNGSTLIIRVT